MQNLYIIAGCNGAGKTTASYTVLPDMLKCKEFINADEIARGLSPFQPEKSAIEAGKLMIQRLNDLLNKKVDFAFETTLSGKGFVNTLKKAKNNNYFITLVFFYLDSPSLAIERVIARKIAGGHNIPEDVIRRRYISGIKNLFKVYIPVSDYWMIINNSKTPPIVIAEGNKNSKIINNEKIFKKLKSI
ncbi:MAG: zeta toxin family protein [Bacteroidales bacterium]|nr:zeta toxin family protein [Bacteroidales bacterium]